MTSQPRPQGLSCRRHIGKREHPGDEVDSLPVQG